MPQEFDPSTTSMMLPDATLFLRGRLEDELLRQNPALASLQELSIKGDHKRTEDTRKTFSRVGQQLGNNRITRLLGQIVAQLRRMSETMKAER